MSGSLCLHTVCMQNSKANSLAQSQYCLPLQSFVLSLIYSMLGSHHIPANAACSPLHSGQIMWSTHSVFCYYLLLVSRYKTGCHGLRVDTGCWADSLHLDRTNRLCLVCKSLDFVEDEQHFVSDRPAHSHDEAQHLDLLQHCCNIADFMSCVKHVSEITLHVESTLLTV
jgi:hypothetical protein